MECLSDDECPPKDSGIQRLGYWKMTGHGGWYTHQCIKSLMNQSTLKCAARRQSLFEEEGDHKRCDLEGHTSLCSSSLYSLVPGHQEVSRFSFTEHLCHVLFALELAKNKSSENVSKIKIFL